MANVLTRGTNLPTGIVEEMFNAVSGHSSLAKLSAQKPIPFNGTTQMVFTMDKEIDVVGENQPKSNGGGDAQPVVIRPVKFEYGLRVSDEFLYGTEEYRMDVLRAFAEGAAKKAAKGFDIAAMHGLNPRTGQPSTEVIGDNHFDAKVSNHVQYDATAPDTTIDSALALIDASGATSNGIAISPAMRSALAAMKANGVRLYPEFAFGANPAALGAMGLDVNATVSTGDVDHAIMGDFSAFRWGYAKEIPLDVIKYGNPDNDAEAGDLAGHNQVYLRAEFYIGWGILAPEYFARVTVGE